MPFGQVVDAQDVPLLGDCTVIRRIRNNRLKRLTTQRIRDTEPWRDSGKVVDARAVRPLSEWTGISVNGMDRSTSADVEQLAFRISKRVRNRRG